VHCVDDYLTSLLLSIFCLYCSRANQDLHSFPTRRSSDLLLKCHDKNEFMKISILVSLCSLALYSCYSPRYVYTPSIHNIPSLNRSEEHTSELQSPYDLVCRLLLEKKKKYHLIIRCFICIV